MELSEARKKFAKQRRNVLARGIEWQLTFQEWLDFWGDDLDNRGPRFWQLVMQRPCDKGPYAIGNIRKGTPRQNVLTRAAMARNKKALELLRETKEEFYFDPTPDDRPERDNLGYVTLYDRFY